MPRLGYAAFPWACRHAGLKALFDQTQTVAGGLWLVKWIDRFSLGRGFTSFPRVRVFMQRLALNDVRQLDRLGQQDISYLIGKPPGSQEPVVAEARDVGWPARYRYCALAMSCLSARSDDAEPDRL